MKVGVLYPRSNAHPGMMADFMKGITSYLISQKLVNEIQIISESIGFGANEKEVCDKAEKLLVLEDVDMLVAFIDVKVTETLGPLLKSSATTTLIVNPGANYPSTQYKLPDVFHLTLQHSFLCWSAGKLAGKLGKTSAAMATTFYDSGYLHTEAIVNGFTASGGNIMFNYINNQRYDNSFEIKQLTEYLTGDTGTPILLCLFDSLPASLFYEQLNGYHHAADLNLFVSPMMLEKEALVNIGNGFNFSIAGYLPWALQLDNIANKVFKEKYFEHTNREATAFALLGWETGQVLQEVFATGKLANEVIESPRGKIKLDPLTNYFMAPVLRSTLKENSNTTEMQIEDITDKEWTDFRQHASDLVSSGWKNTYGCY